jgi:hypothetical protein
LKTTNKYSQGSSVTVSIINIYKNTKPINIIKGGKMRNTLTGFAEKFIGKEVKAMKILFIIVITITMIISTSGLSFAAWTSLGAEIFTASSGLVGGDEEVTVDFNATLHNIGDVGTPTSITWTGVSAGVTSWKAANQYIAVNGFATYSDWGIQIYTNNFNYGGTGNPAGLINTGNTIYSLPMCWRTKTDKLSEGSSELNIYPKVVDGYDVLADNSNDEYYPWFYMMDKNEYTEGDVTHTFGTHQEYATFIGSAGYQHAPTDYATPWATDTTYYVYLGANFTMAMPGVTYSTDTLTVEMYHL